MKVFIHDFAGHPFQAELSRVLANRGHLITHGWFAGDTGPKGRLRRLPNDPTTLSFHAFGQEIDYSKSNFIKRRRGDIIYGVLVAQWIERERPDLAVIGNTPTEAFERIATACLRLKIPYIYWCQDLFSIAATKLLQKKIPILGRGVGQFYQRLERKQMRNARRIIHITRQFCKQTDAWGIPRDKVDVVPNWGAIEELPTMPRNTPWAQQQGLKPGPRFLYSGTLAKKHNPELLRHLSKNVVGLGEVILTSEGGGVDYLVENPAQNLRILPLQPFEKFAQVLASADVLLVVIERDAGEYSVPSKILSYLCAGRPIVLAAPKANLAAQILLETGAGTVVEPEDLKGFANAAINFAKDTHRAKDAGAAGRAYAEQHFRLDRIADRFEEIFTHAMKGNP